MTLVNHRGMWLDEDERMWFVGDPNTSRDPYPIDRYTGRGPDGRYLITLRNPHSPVDQWGRARGVFDLNPDTFMAAWMIDQYLAGAFRAGVPNGYLKVTQPNITQEQADALKARWMGAHGRQRSIAVLNQSTEFVPLTWSPVDANVQEMKRLAMADIAFAFGIAPEVLGVSLGLSGTYSNIKDWWRLHRDFSLSGWIDQIGAVLTALMPEKTNVSVNLDAHTRPDLAERVAIMQAARDTAIDQQQLATMNDLPFSEGSPA
jgi:phage portal protein BeeE